MSELDNILSAVARLPVGDLQQIQDRIKARLSLEGGSIPARKTAKSELSDSWLLDGMRRILYRRRLMRQGFDLIKIAPKGFAEKIEGMQTFLLNCCGRRMSVAERAALGRLCADMLADYALSWRNENFVLGPRTMLNLVDRIPEALDWAFPAYLRSGMLGMLVRVRTSRQKPSGG